MKNRVRKLVMGVAALATVALGGATVASAVSNGNGDAQRSDETALTGDTARARKSYQDFFVLWRDADPEIPVLEEAKQEYEKLK